MPLGRREFLGAAVVAGAMPTNALGQAPTGDLGRSDKPISTTQLAAAVERCRRQWGVPGLSVAIVRGGKPIYVAGHGVRQVGSSTPVNADTLFQIGSNSKAFCAAAAGLLVDEGKLAWNDPIRKHLPDFAMGNPWLTDNITVKDALAHRTGHAGFWSSATAVIDRAECLARVRHEQPVAAFRDSFVYNNIMYGAVEAVIEAVSGQNWSDFVTRRFFQPLGMKRTRPSPYAYWPRAYVTGTFLGSVAADDLHYRHATDANVAMPHMLNTDRGISVLPWQSYDNLAAAGSIVSCAADMSHWLTLHLARGRLDGRDLVKPATMRDMHSRQNFALPDPPGFDPGQSGYGMGWLLRSYRGRKLVEHTGGIEGFPSYVGFMPDDDIGIVILANGFTGYKRQLLPPIDASGRRLDLAGLRKAISLSVYDLLLGNPITDWAAILHADEERERAARLAYFASVPQSLTDAAGPALKLAGIVGRYKDPSGRESDIEIVARPDGLELRFPGVGAYVARLERRGNTIFFINPRTTYHTADFVRFDMDAQGRVIGFDAFNARFEPA